ncbi:MAG: hypothetical protein AB1791_14255 [Chloroflexota bacterium]
MNYRITFSPRASLAITGLCFQQMGIWPMVEKQVQIQQKVIQHKPLEKLLDAFINILADGRGLVEVNSRVKPDEGLGRAFGRPRCADQSTISDTLNACSPENVAQMRTAVKTIYQRYGAGYRHHYGRHWQLLDVDVSGMPAGRQGEGVEAATLPVRKGGVVGKWGVSWPLCTMKSWSTACIRASDNWIVVCKNWC